LSTSPPLPRSPELSFPRVPEFGSIIDVDATKFFSSEELTRLQKLRSSEDFRRLQRFAESADGKRLQSEASRYRRLPAAKPRAGALHLQEAHS